MHAGIDLDDDQAIEDQERRLTTAMWATFVPAGLIGAMASWVRLNYYHVIVLNRFRCAARARMLLERLACSMQLLCTVHTAGGCCGPASAGADTECDACRCGVLQLTALHCT